MKQLEGKVIFLTGGTDGIGFECAKAYLREGASVAIAAPADKRFIVAQKELGSEPFLVATDVSVGSEVKMALELAVQRFGRIDAIHNNAGIAHPSKTLDETSEVEWDLLMNINLKSIYHTTRYGIGPL